MAWLFEGPSGSYDARTEDAVKGFQGKRGLPKTGETDTVTWQRPQIPRVPHTESMATPSARAASGRSRRSISANAGS